MFFGFSKFVDRFFSNRFVNKTAVRYNPLLEAMYRFAYPFSLLLNTIGLTPNQITLLSSVFAVLAVWGLIFHQSLILYSTFWAISLLLDFCDGTVARMSDRVSRTAFRFDHMSDILKVSILLIAFGWNADNAGMWILTSITIVAFLYYSVLSQELRWVRNVLEAASSVDSDKNKMSFQKSIPSLYRSVYTGVLTINGHTLLIFFVIPLGEIQGVLGLAYFSLVSIFGVSVRIRALLSLPKPKTQ